MSRNLVIALALVVVLAAGGVYLWLGKGVGPKAPSPPKVPEEQRVAAAMRATLGPDARYTGADGKIHSYRVPTLDVLVRASAGAAGIFQFHTPALAIAGLAPFGSGAGAAEGWDAELARLTHSRPVQWTASSAVTSLAMNELYPARVYSPTMGQRYLARLKALTSADVDRWCAALKPQGAINCPALPLYLIRIDALFDGGALRPAVNDQLVARLGALPPDFVKVWAEATGADPTTAAVSLAQVPQLFEGAAFRDATFRAALPLAWPAVPDRISFDNAVNAQRPNLTQVLTHTAAQVGPKAARRATCGAAC